MQYFLIVLFVICLRLGCSIDSWDLPVLPSNPPPIQLGQNITKDKLIPRHLWMAVRTLEKTLNYQLPALFERNRGWEIHICSNEMKDEFMNKTFANTSLLWAYHMIHPIAGAAKADLWRYAVLWTYGGAYIDDDSDIGTPLDSVVEPEDTLILAFEKNGFNGNRCYIPKYHLSDFYAFKTEQHKDKSVFHGRILLNWALMVAPRNKLLERMMKNAVEIIRQEFFRESVLRSLYTAHAWEIIGCATGPSLLTATARELVLDPSAHFKYRLGGADFKNYGGKFKAVHIPVKNDPNHYMKTMNRKGGHTDLLTDYLPEKMPTKEQLASWQSKAIQGQNGKEIFVVDQGHRRGIPNFDTFLALNFTMADVIVLSDAKIGSIPVGESMPKLTYNWN